MPYPFPPLSPGAVCPLALGALIQVSFRVLSASAALPHAVALCAPRGPTMSRLWLTFNLCHLHGVLFDQQQRY